MTSTVPVWIDDPTGAAILAVSEDRLTGFIGAMLRADTICRVRQTPMATSLAAGALCAWQVPPDAYLEFCHIHDLHPEAMR